MIDKKQYITLATLHKSGRIWWIKSVQTLRKWVEADKDHDNVLQTIVKGEGIKKRYYIRPENVEKYVFSFTQGKKVSEIHEPKDIQDRSITGNSNTEGKGIHN